MSGRVDSYGEVAAGLALAVRRTGQQASGEAATKGLALPAVLVAGVHTESGWRVWVSLRSCAGAATLHPDDARKLAAGLVEMADVIEGRVW